MTLVQVWLEEGPRLLGEAVGRVRPDVASPHDPHAVLEKVARQSRRLGIVQEHHVVPADSTVQRVHVGAEHLAVVLLFSGAERAVVTGGPVQPVVEALRDGEERRVAVDDHPARVDPETRPVADEEAQHLGDATAVRSGIDVPERGGSRCLHGSVGHGFQPGEPAGTDEAAQRGNRTRHDLDVEGLDHGHSLAYAGPCRGPRQSSSRNCPGAFPRRPSLGGAVSLGARCGRQRPRGHG